MAFKYMRPVISGNNPLQRKIFILRNLMKKTIVIISSLVFAIGLLTTNLIWADRGHMEEGSGTKSLKQEYEEGSGSKEYKDKKHSKDHTSGKTEHMKEGSGGMQPHGEKTDHDKMEEGSGEKHDKGAGAPQREGS